MDAGTIQFIAREQAYDPNMGCRRDWRDRTGADELGGLEV